MARYGQQGNSNWIVLSTSVAGLIAAVLVLVVRYYEIRRARAEAARAEWDDKQARVETKGSSVSIQKPTQNSQPKQKDNVFTPKSDLGTTSQDSDTTPFRRDLHASSTILSKRWTSTSGKWNIDKDGSIDVNPDFITGEWRAFINESSIGKFRAKVALRKPSITSWAGFGFCYQDLGNFYRAGIQDGTVSVKKFVNGTPSTIAMGPKLDQQKATSWVYFDIDFEPGAIQVKYSTDGAKFSPLANTGDATFRQGKFALLCHEYNSRATYSIMSFSAISP